MENGWEHGEQLEVRASGPWEWAEAGAFGVCFEVEDITPAMGCRGEGTPYSTEDREGRQGSGK